MAKPTLATIRSSNSSYRWSHRPTAIFVGGTSGVGEGTAKAFAQATQGRAHIIIVGRSRTRAEEIIASFPKTSESQYDFIQCDVSLIKNVVNAANEARGKLSGSLNYLVLSQGRLDTQGFTPTTEGIDNKMALHFYSRWKFVDDLLPLLNKAAESGQEARVLSVLGPKNAKPLDVEDFGLKNNYSFTRTVHQFAAYNNAMVQEYSCIHPNLSFLHIYPGLVSTGVARDAPWYVRTVISVLLLLGKTSEECGDWMLSALLNEKYKKGGFLLLEFGEEVDVQGDSAENRALLLEHYRKQVADATKA